MNDDPYLVRIGDLDTFIEASYGVSELMHEASARYDTLELVEHDLPKRSSLLARLWRKLRRKLR
jgi:hypothetical protein